MSVAPEVLAELQRLQHEATAKSREFYGDSGGTNAMLLDADDAAESFHRALVASAPSLLSACERLARVDRFLEEHVDTVEEYLGYSSSGPVNDALKAFRALRTEKR